MRYLGEKFELVFHERILFFIKKYKLFSLPNKCIVNNYWMGKMVGVTGQYAFSYTSNNKVLF